MKKVLLIAALTMASAPALASKARLNALGNSQHLRDIQDTFVRPDGVMKYGEWATAEFGTVGTTTTDANGGFVRAAGDSAWGLYLGHQSASVAASRTAPASWTPPGKDFLGAENPINVLYGSKAGDMDWGLNFHYSTSDKKSVPAAGGDQQKQNAMSLAVGASAGAWDARVILGLGNSATNTTLGAAPGYAATSEQKLTGKTSMELGGGYWMDSMYLFGKYAMGGHKIETTPTGGATTTNDDVSRTTIELGVVNTHKQDATEFFYGASLSMATAEDKNTDAANDDTKTTSNTMPIWFGIEAEATSWLVFRGAVKQNFFLFGSTKTETNGVGEANTIAHNTTVSAGAGLKWGKWNLDGTLAAAGSGTFGLDGANFLGTTALTYTF